MCSSPSGLSRAAIAVCVALRGAAAVTNYSTSVVVRDGVALYTVVFLPALQAGQKVGTVMMRTPYGTDTLADEAVSLASIGWAAVIADERGRYRSGGTYSLLRSAANDTYDAVTTFVRQQPWSNGLVAWTGTSAVAVTGYVAPLAAPGPPPGMASQYNIVGSARLRDLAYQGGAYREAMMSGWLTAQGEAPLIAVVQAHEAWGPYWEPTTQSYGDRWALTDWPVLHLAGWYDVFSTAQIADALAFDSAGGPRARGAQYLVVEPGGHCAGGAVVWPNATYGANLANSFAVTLFSDTIGAPAVSTLEAAAAVARARAAVAAVRRHVGAEAGNTTVVWYVLGSGLPGEIGNVWVAGTIRAFTNATAMPLYLGDDSRLTADAPTGASAPTPWTADPSRPIPTVGGNEDTLATCGPQDQRAVEAGYASAMVRFVTAPLTAPLIIQGVITARLWVTSTAVDTDVAVKVTDVFPSGESMLLQDGIVRMRWRNGPFANETAPPLLPDTPCAINVTVGHMAYAVSPGHRIAIAISSYNFPRFSVNPNSGRPVNDTAGPRVVALNAVLHDALHPSALILPLLPVSAFEALRLRA